MADEYPNDDLIADLDQMKDENKVLREVLDEIEELAHEWIGGGTLRSHEMTLTAKCGERILALIGDRIPPERTD